jgi:hypothetical protein
LVIQEVNVMVGKLFIQNGNVKIVDEFSHLVVRSKVRLLSARQQEE